MLTLTQPLLIFIPGLQNICLSFAKPASWFSTDYLFPCQISIHLFSFACLLASLAVPFSHSPFGSITRFHLFARLFSFIPIQLIHCHFSPRLPWSFPLFNGLGLFVSFLFLVSVCWAGNAICQQWRQDNIMLHTGCLNDNRNPFNVAIFSSFASKQQWPWNEDLGTSKASWQKLLPNSFTP